MKKKGFFNLLERRFSPGNVVRSIVQHAAPSNDWWMEWSNAGTNHRENAFAIQMFENDPCRVNFIGDKEFPRLPVRIPIDWSFRRFYRYSCSNCQSIDWDEFEAIDDILRNLVHHFDRIAWIYSSNHLDHGQSMISNDVEQDNHDDRISSSTNAFESIRDDRYEKCLLVLCWFFLQIFVALYFFANDCYAWTNKWQLEKYQIIFSGRAWLTLV